MLELSRAAAFIRKIDVLNIIGVLFFSVKWKDSESNLNFEISSIWDFRKSSAELFY